MKKLAFGVDGEEDDAVRRAKTKRNVGSDDDDDDYEDEDEDDSSFNEFEVDDFIVDDNEEEEDGKQDRKYQRKKEKKKRKHLNSLLLDDDDLELLRGNTSEGIENGKLKRLKKAEKHGEEVADCSGLSDDDVSLNDADAISNDENDELADFIVKDGEGYVKGTPERQWNVDKNQSKKVTVASISAQDEAGYLCGSANELLKCYAVKIADPDDSNVSEMENYMTGGPDSKIGVLERMQMFEEVPGLTAFDDIDKEEKSSWIFNQLATSTFSFLRSTKSQDANEGAALRKISKVDIMSFLELHNLQMYDIPFIAMYRKEKCLSLLEGGMEEQNDNVAETVPQLKWHKILWTINKLDEKWVLLQQRKSALQECYKQRYEEERCIIDDMELLALAKRHFDTIIKSLKLAETERNVDDVEMKFGLHFPPAEENRIGKFRTPIRRSSYSTCKMSGLWKFSGMYGCSPEQFGLCLSLGKREMEIREDPDDSPEAIASKFICPMFETTEAVLKGARHMAAVEISSEPCVREHVRSIFLDNAAVSTSPTTKGDLEIDSFHQFSVVKWLREKPLDKFQDAQWLLIQKAEEEKLLQVTIRLPENILEKLISDSHEIYLLRGGHLWNEERKLILNDAFSKFLLPSLEKEARAMLTARAKNWLIVEYGMQLWNRVSVAPYQRKGSNSGLEKFIQPRVMACCWGPGKPVTTFVMMDQHGELLDILQAGSLTLRSQNVNDQQRKKNDQQCLLNFIRNHRPDVIIIGAANASCTRLKDSIKETILEMEKNPMDIGQPGDGINIIYGDESLPQLYENSEISLLQLGGQEGIVRRAVGLGRFLQNPLAMIATLCGAKREIVSWKLHPLDHFLTPNEKYEVIEMVMVDVTNQVGIDVNLTVNHDWLCAPLQFVSGLGPRTAASLQRELVTRKRIYNRKELASCGLGTKKAFTNAIGFLCIRDHELFSISTGIDPFDDTRIHPESYDLAERLIKAVYGDGDKTHLMEHVRNNLQLLTDFDINIFADNYEMEQGENKRQTLYDIKMELLHGFIDPRKPYEEPTQDEEFSWVSGKNEDVFAEGRTVQAIVRCVLSQRAFCDVNCGLAGMITKDDFLDESDDFSLTEKLHEGDILTCKVKYIDKSKYQVLLTCKENQVKDCANHQNFQEVEPYYCGDPSSSFIKQQSSQGEDCAKEYFMPRLIVHPHFGNMTTDEAVQFLSDKDVGENVFRPSSRGPQYLTLTIKVSDGLYVHKDIIEGQKDMTGITSLLSLGKTLKIGDEIFESLDEVIGRYVDPLVSHLKAMLSFKKFKKGLKAEVDKLLQAEKSENPRLIVYCFGFSYEHPGNFILSYIRTNLHHEYVGLHPRGFKFRKQIFVTVEQLVAYFQKHNDDTQHRAVNGGWQGKFATDRGGRDPSGDDGDGHSGLPPLNGGRGRGEGRGRGRGRGFLGNYSCKEKEELSYDFASKRGPDIKGSNGNNSRGGWGNNRKSGGWGCGNEDGSAGSGSLGGGNESDRAKGSSWGGPGSQGNCSSKENEDSSYDFASKWGSDTKGRDRNNSCSGWGNTSKSGGWGSSNEDGIAGSGSLGGGNESERAKGSSWGGPGSQGNCSSKENECSSFNFASKWGSDAEGGDRNNSCSGWGNTSKSGGWGSSNEGGNAGGGSWSGSKESERAKGSSWGGPGFQGNSRSKKNEDASYDFASKLGSNVKGGDRNNSCSGWANISKSGGWGSSNEGGSAGGGSWDGSKDSERANCGSWGGPGKAGDGSSKDIAWNMCERAHDSNNRADSFHKKPFCAEWGGNHNDTAGGDQGNCDDENASVWGSGNKGKGGNDSSWGGESRGISGRNWNSHGGGSSSAGWDFSKQGGSADGGSWFISKDESVKGGSWGRHGVGWGGSCEDQAGYVREHGHDSHNSGADTIQKKTFHGGWGGNANESAVGGNWNNDGAENARGWGGTGGGYQGGNAGRGRGRSGNWKGRSDDRGTYDQGGRDGPDRGRGWGQGRGRGRGSERGCGNEYGFNNKRDCDNNGSATSDRAASGWNQGGQPSDSWGGSNMGGKDNCWGRGSRAGNSDWGETGNNSRGILGSGPASGTAWGSGAGTGGWGKGDGTAVRQRGSYNNPEAGNSGSGAGSWNSCRPSGGSGWAANDSDGR